MTKLFSILFLISSVCIVSCGNHDPNEQKQHLNGYWTIEKVVLPDGTEKNFRMSTTVDYIMVTGNEGIRKKVQPKLDGTFETGKTVESFELRIEDDSLRMYYHTPYDSWKETVITAKDSSLVVVNRDGNTYFYKEFSPFKF